MRRLLPAAWTLLAWLVLPALAWAGDGGQLAIPTWTVIPFAGLLLSIAVLPIVAGHFWHSNRNRLIVAAVFALPVVGYMVYLQVVQGLPALAPLVHELANYAAFIVLLGSLYVVSGGIVLTGDLEGTAATNTLFLGIGCLLANLIGTTGASVLLIRPLLRTNSERHQTHHIPIFFIFTVSNLGGLLTPLGDPPLFLGFLHGVPFEWTLRLWPQWLLANGIVLAIFFVWDALAHRRESKRDLVRDRRAIEPLRVRGLVNAPFLAGIMVAVLLGGVVPEPWGQLAGTALMLVMAVSSWYLTPRTLRVANAFTWEPIVEVAVLFAGIFICMVPALQILSVRGQEFGITRPWEYFWLTGGLSAFLDNAPTYVTFATVAAQSSEFELLVNNQMPGLDGPLILKAISCGAVFMGALSYIGNGPNFMVKAIAEGAGYKMPSFFGYLGYSCAVLVPVFLLVTIVFFR